MKSATALLVVISHFSCTLCGKCCQNHSLPLTIAEAIAWLEDGGPVAVYCEAIDCLHAPSNPRAVHRKNRSFSVPCGSSSLYVTAILVAVISGACRNLSPDMQCRIYHRRPLVCRIYPAEVNPFIQLDPATKVCPPEAWLENEPPDNHFARNLPSLADQSRQTDYHEAARKGLLCADLGICVTALADEGYIRYTPSPETLLTSLKKACLSDAESRSDFQPWRLFSPSLANGHSALEVIHEKPPDAAYSFLRA